jgi:hypothetical protein
MKNLRVHICAGLLLAAASNAALAQAQPVPQAPAGSAIPLNVDNFRRAESDLVMGPIVRDGGFGKYVHHCELYPVDAPIVRPNRDTASDRPGITAGAIRTRQGATPTMAVATPTMAPTDAIPITAATMAAGAPESSQAASSGPDPRRRTRPTRRRCRRRSADIVRPPSGPVR